MSTKIEDWKTVWITGASTGIGRALAEHMAEPGRTIAVSARSRDKLAALEDEVTGAVAYPMDVCDADVVRRSVEDIESKHGPIDLAVLNAGTWSMTSAKGFDLDAIRTGVDVNYMGVMNALHALLPGMLERKKGHIAITASVAGYRGLPNAIAYGPTKAALINLAETLRTELASEGITVSLVNPGFVDTPLTQDNPFPMPQIMTADDAAIAMLRGLEQKKYEICFPYPFVLMTKALRLMPNAMYFWFVRKFISKG